MPVVNDFERWRVNCVPTAADGKNVEVYGQWFVGDVASAKIGYLDENTHTEWSDPMRCQVVTGITFDMLNRVPISDIELDMETGLGATADITLEKSEDGQRTWSNARIRSMGTGTGQKRVRWNLLGAGRQTVFRFTIDDAVKRVFIAMWGSLRGRVH